MKIKKILSVFLSMLLFLNPILAEKASAMDQKTKEEYFLTHCPKKNSKGGYVYDSCAWKDAEEALLNGTDYVIMRDQGPYGNEDLYFFTFRALDKILDELGLDPGEDKFNEEWETFKKKQNSYFSPFKNILRVGVGSLLGALGGNELYSLAQSNYEGHHKSSHHKSSHKNHHNHKPSHGLEISEHKHQGSRNFLRDTTRVISKLGANAMMLIGAACVGLITSILLKIKYNSEWEKGWKIFDKSYKAYKLNNKKAAPLNSLLEYIKNYSLEDKTIFFAATEPKQVWRAYPINLEGLNYTEEEKASFPEKFKKLAQDIEKNLGRRLEK